MTIPEDKKKINLHNAKTFLESWLSKRWVGDVAIGLIVVLTAAASFGLGRLSILEAERQPVKLLTATGTPVITYEESGLAAEPQKAPTQAAAVLTSGEVFGSKNGTKYYYPWCTGGDRIKAENIRWFATVAVAQKAGYSAAANCSALQ